MLGFAGHAADAELNVGSVFNLLHLAVTDPDDPVGYVDHLIVMRRRNNSHALLFVQAAQQCNDLLPGLGVKVSCGFVGQNDAGIVGQGAGDGDALLLAARELGRLMVVSVAEADDIQKLHAACDPVVGGCSGEDSRQGNILQGRHNRNQVEGLEDIADRMAPQVGQLSGIKLGHVDIVDEHAAAVGLVQAADGVEEGGFPRAGGSHN